MLQKLQFIKLWYGSLKVCKKKQSCLNISIPSECPVPQLSFDSKSKNLLNWEQNETTLLNYTPYLCSFVASTIMIFNVYKPYSSAQKDGRLNNSTLSERWWSADHHRSLCVLLFNLPFLSFYFVPISSNLLHRQLKEILLTNPVPYFCERHWRARARFEFGTDRASGNELFCCWRIFSGWLDSGQQKITTMQVDFWGTRWALVANGLYHMWHCSCDDIFSRFDRTPACVGKTHGQS